MIQTLIKNWWLLAVCGLLEALLSATHLLMLAPDGSLSVGPFALRGTVWQIGVLALAAGACTIAAAVWGSGNGKAWPLAVNGLALSGFGLIAISPLPRGKLGFLPVALLFTVMAMSAGILALAIRPILRRHAPGRWLFGFAGAGSSTFALMYLAWGLGWIKFPAHDSYFLWMSGYFGFSAVCLLALALWLKSQSAATHRVAGHALPI